MELFGLRFGLDGRRILMEGFLETLGGHAEKSLTKGSGGKELDCLQLQVLFQELSFHVAV